MRTYSFNVAFRGNGKEIVIAATHAQALILACASRIKKGLHTYAESVLNTDNNECAFLEKHGLTPFDIRWVDCGSII